MPANGARRSLMGRAFRFRPAELRAFSRPLQDFWQRWDGEGIEPSLDQILAVEQKAILAVGVEKDVAPANLSTTRRKVLEFLGSDQRRDYLDLLHTTANLYFEAGDYVANQRVLEQLLLAEPNDWFVVRDLARVHGVRGETERALTRFEEARGILEEHYSDVEIDEAELWEAQALEARYRAVVATRERPDISREELLEILTPVFAGSQRFFENIDAFDFYVHTIARVADALVENNVPLATMAYVFGKPVEGEMEDTVIEAMGPVPIRLMMALHDLEESFLGPRAVFDAFKEVDRALAKKAVTLFVRMSVRNTLFEKGVKGKREIASMLKALGKSDMVLKPALQEVRADVQAALKRLREKAAAAREKERAVRALAKPLELLEAVRTRQRSLTSHGSERLVQSIRAAFQAVENEAARDELRGSIVNLIETRTANGDEFKDTTLFASEVWKMDEVLQQRLRGVYERALQQADSRKRIVGLITQVRANLAATTLAIAKGEHAPQQSFSRPDPDKDNSVYKWGQAVHDLFFVRMRDMAEVREVFYEVEAVHAEPVAMLSSWYGMLAGHAPKAQQKIKLFRRSLAEDSRNVMSRIELARALGISGNVAESNKILQPILDNPPNPHAWVKACCIRSANRYKQIDKMVNAKAAARKIDPEVIEARASLTKLLGLIEDHKEELFYDDDCRVSLVNLGLVFSLVHDHIPAMQAYSKAVEYCPADVNAVQGVGTILKKQGAFAPAAIVYAKAVAASKGLEAQFHHFAAIALFHHGDFERALKMTDNGLTLMPEHTGILISKARIFAMTDRVVEAEQLLEEVVERQEAAFPRFEGKPYGLRNAKGNRELLRAEIASAKGEQEEAEAAYRRAIEFLEQDFASEFGEMEARWELARDMQNWAFSAGDEDLMERALAEAQALLDRFSFFPPAHAIIIGPLMFADREEEVLEHLRWLVESFGVISEENMANLIILGVGDNHVGEEARRLFSTLRGQVVEGQDFDGYVASAKQVIVSAHPTWDDGRLDVVEQWES